jgi:dTDP-4-amino-4,6-dideoxygalactose transaminase
MGCFSFYVSKNLGAYGEGGLVVTDDKDLYDKAKMLRSHGENERYFNVLIGGNFRLDAIQAAVLLVKLQYLDSWTGKRREHAQVYDRLLEDVPVETPSVKDGNFMIYNQYVIKTSKRDRLMHFLKANDIATKIYYPVPIPLQECYKSLGYTEKDLSNSVKASNTTLALPIYPELTRPQIEYVAGKIHEFFTNGAH